MSRVAFLAFVVGIVVAGSAHAQAPPPEFDDVKEMVGTWEISNADRDHKCTLTFSTDAAAGGFKLALDQSCATALPMLKDVVVWNVAPNGPLRLLDAKGHTAIELNEVESGIYEGERRGEGLYFMQPQAAIAIPPRTPEQMVGDWAFLREADKPLCTLTLSNATGPAAGYKLTVKKGCDAGIAGFGLSTWQLDGDQLVLSGSGGSWRFVESDTNIWERVPPSTNPLLLLKP